MKKILFCLCTCLTITLYAQENTISNNDLTKAIGLYDLNTNTDKFIVWGNGVVNIKKLYATENQVRTDAMGISWPDYVFEQEYALKSLEEVAKYIESNKHLEGVPSAKEIEENGVNVVQMDAAILKKVEELTLYIIELEKRIKELEQDSKKD